MASRTAIGRDPDRDRRRSTPDARPPSTSPARAQAAQSRIPIWDNARFVTRHARGHRARDPAADRRLEQRADRSTCSSTRSTCRRSRSSAATSRKRTPPGTRQMRRSSPTSCCRTSSCRRSGPSCSASSRAARTSTRPSRTGRCGSCSRSRSSGSRCRTSRCCAGRWSGRSSLGRRRLLSTTSTRRSRCPARSASCRSSCSGWQLRQWKLVDRWRRRRGRRSGRCASPRSRCSPAGWLSCVIVNIEFFRDSHLQAGSSTTTPTRGSATRRGGRVSMRLGLIAARDRAQRGVLRARPAARHDLISVFGQATMYVYLLHSFVLYPIRESGVLKDDHSSAVWLLDDGLRLHRDLDRPGEPAGAAGVPPADRAEARLAVHRTATRASAGRDRSSRTDPTGARRD